MKLTRSIGLHLPTLGRTTLMGLALVALGCPGDDSGTTTDAVDSSGTTTTTTTPLTSTTNPDPDTSTGTPPDTTSGTTTAATDSTGGSSSSGGPGTSTGMETDTDGDTEATTTGGMAACEVMLPPPPMCAAPGDGFPGTPNLECDPTAQTGCAPDEKCMPWANDGGGSWNATTCTPLDPAPNAVGDPCTVVGSGVSGIDDCEAGAMCWDVDPATNMGTCIELCGCSYATPICDGPSTVCSISNNSSLTICTDVCNPLDPMACDAGQGCYPVGSFFQCAPDASGGGGMPGDPCMFINGCEPGTVCIGAAAVPGCAGGVGCCVSACSVTDPAPGCPAGTSCQAWYAPGTEPDACLGDVGVCAAP
ncbi:MAG: hypothetical protein AB1Z98_15945 [Nannocystaceae bacterium]